MQPDEPTGNDRNREEHQARIAAAAGALRAWIKSRDLQGFASPRAQVAGTAHSAKPESVLPVEPPAFTLLTAEPSRFPGSQVLIAAGVAMLLVVPVGVAIRGTGRVSSEHTRATSNVHAPASEPAETEGTPARNAAAATVPTAATEPTEPVAANERLVLTLSTQRTCWLRTSVDGGEPEERLLPPGATITMTVEREAALRIGDASAVSLLINDRQTRPLGAEGRVANLLITPANFQTLLE